MGLGRGRPDCPVVPGRGDTWERFSIVGLSLAVFAGIGGCDPAGGSSNPVLTLP